MFCTRCGKELRADDRFCFDCGTATAKAFYVPHGTYTTLTRPLVGGKISGVCAGFARYLGVDVTLIRILALVLLVWPVPFVGGIAYLIAMLVMPHDPVPAPAPYQQQHPITT